jgi:hypothetical protein
LDEIAHELDATGVVDDLDFDALGTEICFWTLKGDVFTHDDAGDFVEQSCAAAHGTGGEGGIQGATLINGGFQAAGIFQAVHFRMMDDAGVLHALIVPASDDLAIEDEDGADGDATGGETFFGFFEGGFKKCVHACF